MYGLQEFKCVGGCEVGLVQGCGYGGMMFGFCLNLMFLFEFDVVVFVMVNCNCEVGGDGVIVDCQVIVCVVEVFLGGRGIFYMEVEVFVVDVVILYDDYVGCFVYGIFCKICILEEFECGVWEFFFFFDVSVVDGGFVVCDVIYCLMVEVDVFQSEDNVWCFFFNCDVVGVVQMVLFVGLFDIFECLSDG